MVDIIKRFKILEEQTNLKKAEKTHAEKKIKEIEEQLKKDGIKPEDLDKKIKEEETALLEIEKRIEKELKEAEDILNANSSTDSK